MTSDLYLSSSPLSALGLYGLESLSPIVLAALLTEQPLLLIGPHGTAKTLLLTRIAEALGLENRHYNASLLNFDDLIGFPLPDANGSLRYVETPASIWGAQAVIFDEISRCRPDIQNKLFPIIHERRAQGLKLTDLRFRWAAMNPPSVDDDGYRGSEPLDPALADRFAFIAEMPSWSALSEADQLRVVTTRDEPVSEAAKTRLGGLLASARQFRESIQVTHADGIAEYVRVLINLLAQAQLPLSPRRANILFGSTQAVHAASLALASDAELQNSAYLSVVNGLPQRAYGASFPEAKLLAAHKEAWRLAGIAEDDPLKAVLVTTDPLERLQRAISSRKLAKSVLSTVVADVLAALPNGSREAAVVHLFENDAVGRLNAAIAEQAGSIYREIAAPAPFSENVHASHSRFAAWKRLRELLAGLDPNDPKAHLHANAMVSLFAAKKIIRPEEAEAAFSAFQQTAAALAGKVAA